MRALNLILFDDSLSGTSATWYSPATLYDKLGKHDQIVVQAEVGDVVGTSPTLTVTLESSCDGQHWLNQIGIPIIQQSLTPQSTYVFGVVGGLLALLRLKVTLGGVAPACRLKLGVTCRDL